MKHILRKRQLKTIRRLVVRLKADLQEIGDENGEGCMILRSDLQNTFDGIASRSI